MTAFLLDTTVIIDLLRGRSGAVDGVRRMRAAGDSLYACAINVEETVRGLRPNEDDAAQALFSGIRVAPLTEREGWQAGEWRREFAAQGITLSQADCLIAAAARTTGARLVTGNPKDFPMEELSVDHWPVGA